MTFFELLHDLFGKAAAAPTGILSVLPQAIQAVAPDLPDADVKSWADAFAAPMEKAQINTPKRCAAFLGQMAVETGGFKAKVENLNYSAQRLVQVWPSRFPSIEVATPYAHNERALADKVYNGRMGNVVGTDDGYNFRGDGPIQLTGRSAHAAFGATVGKTADEVAVWIKTPAGGAASAVWYWTTRNLNPLADAWDIDGITQKVNGGMTGADQRSEFSDEELKVFGG
jgi:putative chitinase